MGVDGPPVCPGAFARQGPRSVTIPAVDPGAGDTCWRWVRPGRRARPPLQPRGWRRARSGRPAPARQGDQPRHTALASRLAHHLASTRGRRARTTQRLPRLPTVAVADWAVQRHPPTPRAASGTLTPTFVVTSNQGPSGRARLGHAPSLRRARVGPRVTPSQSAHSPQSPQKVRNSASIGRRRPSTPNQDRRSSPGFIDHRTQPCIPGQFWVHEPGRVFVARRGRRGLRR